MINTIQQLKKNHQNFDVIWNKIGTEVQKDLVKTAPELLTALGAWYNRSNELIFELEDQIEQDSLVNTAVGAVDDDESNDIDDIEEFDDFDDDDEELDEDADDDESPRATKVSVNNAWA
jgi:hypothetical protein